MMYLRFDLRNISIYTDNSHMYEIYVLQNNF